MSLVCVVCESSVLKVPFGGGYFLYFQGSENFWYILIVAFVLTFQCITTDIYIFKVTEESQVAPTLSPANSSTRIYTWASFRTTNKSLLYTPGMTTPFSLS